MNRLRLRGSGFRVAAVAVLAGLGVVVPATAAWAPHVPQLLIAPGQARPGDQVAVSGTRGYGYTNPVEIHLDAVDGPLLGSFRPDTQVYAAWGPGTITIPADTKPGTYTLFATQKLTEVEQHIRGVPARATIEVIGAGGPPVAGRPLVTPGDTGTNTLVKRHGPSGAAYVLVGLGVAGLAMFVAGVGSVVAGRRRTASAEAAR